MIYLLSLLGAMYCSCLEIPLKQQEPRYQTYSSQLCEGDFLQFDNKAIQFEKVISDSRCPKGATCIWAGEVKVLVEFFEDGKSLGRDTISGSNFPIADTFKKTQLSLSEFIVSPYPSVKYKIKPEEYSVNIEVTKIVSEEN